MLALRRSAPSYLSIALFALVGLSQLVARAAGYQVLVSSQDEVRQVCSGMWGKGKQDAFIEVLFTPASRGQLALVIFEWEDASHLGIDKNGQSTENEWSDERIYICTLDALDAGLCTENDLGRFITTPTTLPSSESSIFTASVRFDPVPSAPQNDEDKALGTGPYRYEVKKKGYYCVGHVPVVLEGTSRNTSYEGVVDFENAFPGHLPASEYPKVFFYFIMFLLYLVLGIGWIYLTYKHRRDLLPIQSYISATILFLVVEMLVVWRYYAYLNDVGHPGVAGALLVLVAILNAARNSLSFFMLLITSMGYGVVRPSLGAVMLKVRLLAIIHFGFGVLYSLGTVIIPLESAGIFMLVCIIPLAFSLTAFLMWTMWSLNSTIADLGARRQTYKKSMFTRLYRILLMATLFILAFFVVSTLSFSARESAAFGPTTWQTRWILLDGWLGVLYLIVFTSIAWLWRPTGENRRLALSDELPQDEEEAHERERGASMYDVAGMTTGEDEEDDDDDGKGESMPLKNVRRGGGGVGNDAVVFDVGSDDEDDDARELGRVGSGGYGRHSEERSSGEGEHRALRMEDSDEEGDITNLASGRGERPPSYNSKRDD